MAKIEMPFKKGITGIDAKCSGCNTCLLACAIVNFQEINPSRSLLRIEARFPAPGDYRIHLCDQCGECAGSCPENAIFIENGAYRVDSKKCTGCLICIDSCPQQVLFRHEGCDTPVKCNLCGECVRACPRDAIVRRETQDRKGAIQQPKGGLQ